MKNLKLITILLCTLIITPALPHRAIFFNNIIMRRYYIQRLTQSIYFLSLLDTQKYDYCPCNIITQNKCFQIDCISFMHPKINICIKRMLLTTSLNPLLSLLQEIQQYRYLNDERLMYELILLIFTVHKQILFSACEANGDFLKTITLNDIILISEKINQLPIAEVLSAIDMLITELPPFLEKYEFNTKISWKEWLKKYWWVPPIFGAWFALKVLFRLQKPQYYFSGYNFPKPPINLSPLITDDPALLEIRDLQENN